MATHPDDELQIRPLPRTECLGHLIQIETDQGTVFVRKCAWDSEITILPPSGKCPSCDRPVKDTQASVTVAPATACLVYLDVSSTWHLVQLPDGANILESEQ